jgi:hypothetical protein
MHKLRRSQDASYNGMGGPFRVTRGGEFGPPATWLVPADRYYDPPGDIRPH